MAIFPKVKGLLDPIRQKHVAATPEEGVRQSLVEWLLVEKGVPKHLMETECALSQIKPGAKGRVDLLVHGFRQGRRVSRPWLLVECKRAGEADWSLLEVQVNRYIRVVQPEYLLLAIGSELRTFHICGAGSANLSVLPIAELPHFTVD